MFTFFCAKLTSAFCCENWGNILQEENNFNTSIGLVFAGIKFRGWHLNPRNLIPAKTNPIEVLKLFSSCKMLPQFSQQKADVNLAQKKKRKHSNYQERDLEGMSAKRDLVI